MGLQDFLSFGLPEENMSQIVLVLKLECVMLKEEKDFFKPTDYRCIQFKLLKVLNNIHSISS